MGEENFVRARTILPEKYSLHDGLGELAPRKILKFSRPKCISCVLSAHLQKNLAIKNTNFTLPYILPECFRENLQQLTLI